MRYRFAATERAAFPVRVLCRIVGVAVSGIYAWRRRRAGRRREGDRRVSERIGAIFAASRRTGACPRARMAGPGGRPAGPRRATGRGRPGRPQAGRTAHVRGRPGRRAPAAPHPAHHRRPPRPPGRAESARPELRRRPDAVWPAHLSYIPTGEGWRYLAAIKDMATREIPPVPLRGPEDRLWLVDGRPPPRGTRPRRAVDGDPAPAAAAGADPLQRQQVCAGPTARCWGGTASGSP